VDRWKYPQVDLSLPCQPHPGYEKDPQVDQGAIDAWHCCVRGKHQNSIDELKAKVFTIFWGQSRSSERRLRLSRRTGT
jgi:hypothetical protein